MSGTVAAHPEKHQQAAASQVCAGKLSAITVQRMKVLPRLPKRLVRLPLPSNPNSCSA
jgi:hypothetical protein